MCCILSFSRDLAFISYFTIFLWSLKRFDNFVCCLTLYALLFLLQGNTDRFTEGKKKIILLHASYIDSKGLWLLFLCCITWHLRVINTLLLGETVKCHWGYINSLQWLPIGDKHCISLWYKILSQCISLVYSVSLLFGVCLF